MRAGVVVRDIEEHDVAPLDIMLQAAYGTSRSLAPRLRAAMMTGTARTFVVDVAGEPAGMATLHDYRTVGYVALVGVDPAHQRRGIARGLMDVLIADAGRRGIPEIALESSAAGEPLYHRLGFIAHGATLVYGGPAATPSGELAGSERARKPAARIACERDHDGIVACDRRIVRADRSATLLQRLRAAGAEFYVTRSAERVTGFVERHDDVVGPWIAESPAAAEALLEAAMASAPGKELRVLVPSDNTDAISLLTARGWSERRRNTHMVRGGLLHATRPSIYGLISLGEG